MNKRMLFILLVFISLCIGAYFYVNNFFLPVKLKNYIETKASEQLKRKVTFEEIRYDFLKGFTVRDIKIFDDKELNKIFTEIEEASFNLLFLPIIKNKNIIIPSITITSPHILLTKSKDQIWNFSDLTKLSSSTKGDSDFKFFLRKLSISKGIVDVIDYSQNNPVQHHIENIHLNITLMLSKEAKIKLFAAENKTQSEIQFDGKVTFAEKNLIGHLKVRNINPHAYIQTFNLPALPFQTAIVKEGDLTLELKKDFLTASGLLIVDDILIEKETTTIKTNLKTDNLNLRFDQGEIDLTGIFALTNTRIEQGKNILRLDLTTDITKLKFLENSLNIQAIVQGKDIIGGLNGHTIKAKNIAATNLLATNTPDSSVVTATIVTEDLDLRINDYSIQTTSTMNVFKATRQSNIWDIQTDLNLNPFLLSNKNVEISSNIQIPALALQLTESGSLINATTSLKQLQIKTPQGLTFNGQPDVKVKLSTNNNSLNYSADISLYDATLGPFEEIGTIEHVKGDIKLLDNLIQTTNLKIDIMNNTLNLSGLLKDFKNPFINVTANSTDLDLNLIDGFLTKFWKEKKLTLSGLATTEINYAGPALKINPAALKGKTELKATNIKVSSINEAFTNISGGLTFENDSISWSDFKGSFNDTRYVLNGNLIGLSRPTIETSLRSKDLNLETKVYMNLNTFDILALKGRIYNSEVRLEGKVGYKDPLNQNIDLKGNIKLNLNDLTLIPQLKKTIQQTNAKGILQLEGLFSGKLTNSSTWNINIAGQSNSIELKGHQFNSLSFYLNPIEDRPDAFQFDTEIYGGILKIVSALNIKNELLPYKANVTLTDLNLALLRKQVKTKTENLSGMVNIWSELSGNFKNLDNLTGRGSMAITDGMLGKLIPQLEQSYFTGAKGDFEIKNQKIITKNLQAFSPTIDLKVQGWVAFNQQLDLMVYPNYEKLKLLKSEKWEQITAPLLKDMINIKVTGTLNNRKYSVKTTPGKVLKKTSDILTEGVKGIGSILEGVLDQSNF